MQLYSRRKRLRGQTITGATAPPPPASQPRDGLIDLAPPAADASGRRGDQPEPELDSRMGDAKTSRFASPASPLPGCLLADAPSRFGLSGGELVARQLESGVSGSRHEERDSSLVMTSKAAPATPAPRALAGLSLSGDSEVGAGVEGSVLSAPSRLSSAAAGLEGSDPGASPSPMLRRCCSSMIFFRYLPWASIRSWSCLWTCDHVPSFRNAAKSFPCRSWGETQQNGDICGSGCGCAPWH